MEILNVDVPVWVTLIMVAILLYTFMMSRDFWTFRRMGIPGPTPLPIIGNMVALWSAGFRAFERDAIQKYGKVFGYYDIISPNLVVADKEMLRDILVRKFANFPDRRTLDGLSGDIEHGLLNRKGDQWKQNRSVIRPAYSSGKIRQMVPLIQQACDTLLKTSRNAMNRGNDGQVDIYRLFGGYTMDVISSTAFGIHVDSQSNPDDLFVIHVKKMLEVKLFSPWLILIMLAPRLKRLLILIGVCILPADSQAYFRKLTTELVRERREGRKEIGRKDFLHLVVDAHEGRRELDGSDENSNKRVLFSNKKGLAFDEILANTEVFFLAGYETTTTTLTMNAYNLATNPECQEKLREEITETIGSGEIDYENVEKLRYLDMCISETLRMCPPITRVNRTCVKTTKIKSVTIPAGMTVTVPIYALHHDPEVWEKPEVFNPERFSKTARAYDPLDYIPFGHGPRNCIALRLALLEVKMVTADLVRNFRLCVSNKTNIPPTFHHGTAFLRPTDMWLKLEDIK